MYSDFKHRMPYLQLELVKYLKFCYHKIIIWHFRLSSTFLQEASETIVFAHYVEMPCTCLPVPRQFENEIFYRKYFRNTRIYYLSFYLCAKNKFICRKLRIFIIQMAPDQLPWTLDISWRDYTRRQQENKSLKHLWIATIFRLNVLITSLNTH